MRSTDDLKPIPPSWRGSSPDMGFQLGDLTLAMTERIG